MKKLLPASTCRNAFTLIELLVVMGIVIVLVAVSAPLLKTLSKSNGTASGTNLVRAFLANARSTAIAQHRQAGVVFFEETAANAGALTHTGQTAMQIIVELPGQNLAQFTDPYAHASAAKSQTNTIFVPNSNDRQYLPAGIMVATLNDDPTKQVQNFQSASSRVILFNADGQMVLRNGIARPDATSGSPGQYSKMLADWNIATKAGAASTGVSCPGVLVFNKAEYDTESGSMTNTQRAAWLQTNAQIVIVNAYTGGIIR